MNDLKVLFIYPNLRGMNMLPYSIGLFTSILRKAGCEVRIFDTTYYEMAGDFDSDKQKEKNLSVRPFDMDAKGITLHTTDPFDDLEELVKSYQPNLVAISVTEDMFPLGMRLLERIDKYGILTIMGGVFPTFAPAKVLSHKEVDVACVGEGEEPLLELCTALREGKDYSAIKNLWVKKPDGEIVKNPMRHAMDVNSNPLPDFSLFEDARIYRPMAGKVYRMLPVETHRGCPYACTYCNSPATRELYKVAGAGNFMRKKSIQKVKEELDYYMSEYKAEYFYFWADTFFAYSNAEFDEFVEMYNKYKIPFWCQTRPETITDDRIRKLKDVGLHRMSLGIEHGNEEFRKRLINRRVTNDLILKAFEIIAHHQLPAGVSVNNIVGFPTETPELAMDTVELNRQISYAVDTANCYAFTPFHGTPLREMSVKLGYIQEDTFTGCLTGEPVLNMPQFPKARIKGIMKTFNMYIRFPKDRWPEIRMAEEETPEGLAIFEKLRKEFLEKYYTSKAVDD